MKNDSPEERIYEKCPFCQEEHVNVDHLTTCSIRDAKILGAQYGEKLPDMVGLLSKFCRVKTLCDTFESSSDEVKDRMWCCQECYAFGEGSVPDFCPECKSFATSPARIFMEEDETASS